jgi:hypothetical protein
LIQNPEENMTTKKAVTTVREDLRLLGDATNAIDADTTWLTPEFWTMTAGAVSNLITVAVLVGWITQSDAETLTKALTAVVGSSQLVVINSALIWRYITSRTEVKNTAVIAKYSYMGTVAAEQMRLRNKNGN